MFTMVPILLILALAGQCLGIESEQELAQVSGAARHAHLASPSDGVQLHRGANIFNSPSESCDVKLDAEGLARSLSSDDPASSHPATVLPAQHHLSITIDAETAGGSKPNEVVQTPTSFTDLTQPEPSNAEGQSAIDQIPAALENDYFTNPHSDTRPSTSCPSNARIPQSREAKSHAETSQKNDECAICLDDVHASIAPDLKCKHLFHEQCIHDWIRNYRQKNHLNCPRCIQALAKEESPASESDKNSAFWEHLAKLKGPVSKTGGCLSRTELGGQFLTFGNTRIDPRRLQYCLFITCPELVPAQRGVHLLNGLVPAQQVLTKLVPAQRPSKQGNLLTELVPDLLTKLVPDLLTELVPDLLTELVPDLLTELVPDLLTELVPDLLTELVPAQLAG
ncbi:hypothetical protein PCANC_16624 [Puccinia coronata f. sp. avenae]|uniref:RING-type domain-containing protein n=1 Tax=Puccinia coronata f. sp. avenae TaxID=200324 RepID=A0A2N5UAZ8_9BASI|nr:hypothetical protein PCANC_16624 [Puccinia coronata f. sp. avenae]PLW34915.1 hypothetical protein PCASD_14755 [Puccinia coronata f. sp. avenae]